MSAAPTRPKAPTNDVDTPARPIPSARGVVSAPRRLRLNEARAHLVAAADAIDGWYARQTTPGHSYVADGHEAIRLIDAATRELHRVRAALIGEIRADEDERAVRVDRVITEFRARRIGDPSGDSIALRGGNAA